MITALNHFTVIAEDPEADTRLLRRRARPAGEGHRPDLGFPGAWLYADGPQALLHVYFGRPRSRAACRGDRSHGSSAPPGSRT